MGKRRPAGSGRKTAVLIAATIVAVATLTPSVGLAGPAQEEQGSGDEMDTSRAVIEIDIDVAEADTTILAGTLAELSANVAAQLSQLDAAETAVTNAEIAVTAADQAVTDTEAQIDVLVQQSDAVVVGAFVNPPAAQVVDTLSSDSVGDASIKQAVLGMQADSDADVLAQLDDARDQLEVLKDAQRAAVRDAESSKFDAEAALADLQAATSQQAEFIGQVNQRLEAGLYEAEALKNIDPALAAELSARQAELAAQVQEIMNTRAYEAALAALAEAERQRAEEAANAPPPPITLGSASGSLSDVACPEGGSITVDSTLAGPLANMLAAAAADGVVMCGSGYRSPQEQIQVRMNNCGTSYYDIYEAPPSSCSPPTARPGTSMHEQGLAIDFTCNGGGVIASRSSPCYQWLDDHAASYGLYNLPSEAWHFSTNGN